MLCTVMDYANVPYYHGSITRQQALNTLSNKRNGSFLLRKSQTTRNGYAISLMHEGSVVHYSITQNDQSNYYTLGNDSSFATPIEVCEHFMREQGCLKARLAHPVSFDGSGSGSTGEENERASTSNVAGFSGPLMHLGYMSTQNNDHHSYGWFHGNITTQDGALRLQAVYENTHQDGIYLVRQKDPCLYVMCLMFEGVTRRYKILYDIETCKYRISGRTEVFDTIVQLVEYYKDPQENGLVCRLITPCKRPTAELPSARRSSSTSSAEQSPISPKQEKKKSRSLSHTFAKFFMSLASPFSSILPKNVLDTVWSDSPEETATTKTFDNAPETVQNDPYVEPVIKTFLSRYRRNTLAKDCMGYRSPYRNVTQRNDGGIAPDLYVSRADVKIDRVLGQGHFGTVNLGVCKILGEPMPCAVKTLTGHDVVTNKKELLHEAAVMQKLDHPYIVRLLAVCDAPTADSDLMIVVEYAPLGDMLAFIRQQNEASFPAERLALLATQICDGMAYLASKNVVHRDLAARNILLVSENFAKISDFGMSRILHESKNYYWSAKPGLWPVRWYPPEVFGDYKFSSKGDVWSFGIVLWEIFSYGKKPYENLRGSEVLMMLQTGKRLNMPQGCREDVYEVMNLCWSEYPADRPRFDELLPIMQKLQDGDSV